MASALDKADLYHDFSGLDSLRAHRDSPEALRAACRQFESFFTRELLKTMREANEALGDNELTEHQGSDFFREMYDDQLSVTLSKSRGLGLADLMYNQLGGKHDAAKSVDAASKTVPERLGVSAPVTRQDDKPVATPESAEKTGPQYPVLGSLLAPRDPNAPHVTPAERKDAVESESLLGDGWAKTAEAAIRDFSTLPSPLAFVKTIWPFAKKAAQELGVSPRVLIAQAALETGWGRSILPNGQGESSNNLFNIKAGGSWDGKKTSVATLEYEDGIAVKKRANFRAYDSLMDSFSDYVHLIKESPRYQEALESAGDVHAYTRALQEAGYATDPSYASKINKIYHSDTLVDALRSLKF